MTRDLPPGAYERLLAAGEPLRDAPAAGAIDLERYELRGELGRGGMGVVHDAWDRELGRPVALKVLTQGANLSGSARQRFLREARAAARLVHPHIATVYDATPDAIAMQRVDGVTLDARAWDEPRELVPLVRDAALAIHYAHGEGIVHRDVKPANLMVEAGDRPHVYVMDFGLVKERAVKSSLSLSGGVVGTPAYMAPEQAAGRGGDVGPRTDVYGLGATLYACLAGGPPFEAEDVLQLLRSVADDEPRPLRTRAPAVDRDLATIVAKCMEKDPARRYASALALASDLQRWLDGEPVEARPASLAYRLRRYVSRRQGAFVAGLAAAGVAALIAAPLVMNARERRIAAESQRALVDRVFSLSDVVQTALREAGSARASGVGHEQTAFEILEAAVGECQAFLAERADVAHPWFFLGELRRAQGRHDEALVAFDRAAELRDDLERLPYERGLALAALVCASEPYPDEPPHPERAEWRRRAIEDLTRALRDEPAAATTEWHFARGQLAWLRGDLEGAVEALKESIEMDALFRDAHFALSRVYLATGDDELAWRHSVITSDLVRGLRPAYLVRGPTGDSPRPERELLTLSGIPELLFDFNLLLHVEPDDATAYGLRGQVQLRRALRAQAQGASFELHTGLEIAAREFSSALTVRPELAAALVNRGACRVQLARVLKSRGDDERARQLLQGAVGDYDAAVRLEPDLAVAWFDRALARLQRAGLAQVAMHPSARRERESARSDARRALELAGDDHPWRWRFEALVAELG